MAEELVKLKSILPHRSNQSIVLPDGLGEVKFDENCIIEVSEEIAEKILKMDIGIVTVEPEPSLDKDTLIDESTISKLSKVDLQGICKGNEFPEEEWAALTKPNLVSYILSKVEEAAKTKSLTPPTDPNTTIPAAVSNEGGDEQKEGQEGSSEV